MFVNIFLFEGFHTMGAFGPAQIFGSAEDKFCIRYISMDGGIITSHQGAKVWTEPLNPKEIEGVLLTMYDARTNLGNEVVEEVRKYFREKVYETIIPRNIRLSEAPSHGKPIIDYDPRSRGAEVYQALAKEVVSREEK